MIFRVLSQVSEFSDTFPSDIELVLFFRAIKSTVGGFPRPLLDLSAKNFAKLFDHAFESPLVPPFDPYLNSLNYVLASYVIPYVGLVAYVGNNPNINGYQSKRVSSYQSS